MDTILVLLVLIISAILVYLIYMLRKMPVAGLPATPPDLSEIKGMLQSFQTGMGMLDSKLSSNISQAKEAMENKVSLLESKLTSHIDQRITTETRTVANGLESKLNELERRLNTSLDGSITRINTRLSDVKSTVDSQLIAFQNSLTAVNQQLSELTSHTAQLPTVADGINFLQKVLVAPHSRGRLGELLLETLLADAMPKDLYDLQHDLGNGLKVDAVIFLPERGQEPRKLPIDAKFPLAKVAKDDDPEKFKKELVTNTRQRMEEVHKYVNRDTIPIAFCYIPSESLFQILMEADPDLVNEGFKKSVVLVSPGMLYVYLKLVIVGATAIAVEEQVYKIAQELRNLLSPLQQLEHTVDTLQGHIRNASNRADDVGTKLKTWRNQLSDMLDKISATALPAPSHLDPAAPSEEPNHHQASPGHDD